MFNLFGRRQPALDVNDPFLPDGYWNLDHAPFDKRFSSWIFSANFTVDTPQRTIKFAYVVPAQSMRGFVYVFETWDYFLLTQEADKTRALTAARQKALVLYRDATLQAHREYAEKQKQAAVAQANSDVARAEQRTQLQKEAAGREAERQAADAKEESRKRLLAAPIPFAGVVPGGLILGTEVKTGDLFKVELKHLQHMLIAGVSGSGKSVLLHLLCRQMLELPDFEEVILADLKDGVEFDRYRENGKAKVVWEFDDVVPVVDRLAELARERSTVMRANRWQQWRGQRVALVIDEFTELQTAIDAATERDEKAKAKRLMANLLSLARRARAYGIILIIAVQKATDDAIPSALRNNLGCRLVLRCGSSLMARSMLDIGDDIERLSERPTGLPDGRFYYHDTRTGTLRRVQAHVAPGVELS